MIYSLFKLKNNKKIMSLNRDYQDLNHLKIGKANNEPIQHILKNTTYFKISGNDENNEIIKNKKEKKIKTLFNQINTINKYGLLYYYDENGIYFFDNKNINNILTEKKIENNFLFYLKSFQKIFKLEILELKCNEECANKNMNNTITYMVIISKGEKGNFIIYINIDTLFKEVSKQESINIKNIFKIKEEEKISQNIEENDLNKNNFSICNDIIFTIVSKKNENNEKENMDIKEENSEEKKNENINKVDEELDKEIPLNLDMEINIQSMIIQNYFEPNKFEGNKIIYIENDFNDIIPINLNRYLILKTDNELDVYNNYKIIKSFKQNINYIYYYEKLCMIILIIDNNVIGYNSENFEEKIYLKKEEYALNDNKIIFCDIINNFILLIAQKDKIINYFIDYDFKKNKINKIYYDEYEAINKNKKFFSIYEEENGLYYLIDKNNILDSLAEKIYYLKNNNNKNISIYSINFNNEKEVNKNKIGNIIGMNIIKFTYENYNQNIIKIKDITYDELYILVSLDINGNMNVYYIINIENKNKLKTIENNFYNLNNKFSEISLNSSVIFSNRIKYIKESNKNKYKLINAKLKSIKKEYEKDIICNNINQKLNIINKKYIKLINNIKIGININNINDFLTYLSDLQNSLNNLENSSEEMNNYFIKEEESNKYILNESNNLYNLENEIIKRKIKKHKLIDESKTFNSLKSYLNINNFGSIEKIFENNVFKNYIPNEIIERAKNMFDLYNKVKKKINISSFSKNELDNLNEEFQRKLDLCNYMMQKLKNQYMCFKNMNKNEENIKKLYDNAYSLYLNAFKEYILKFNKIIIKELSKQNLMLSKLNTINKIESNKNEIYENKFNNQYDIDNIFSESLNMVNGKMEYFENNKIQKFIDLDNEFPKKGKKENEINMENIFNLNEKEKININPYEQRNKNYEILFEMKNKLIEINKDNNTIIEILKNNEKEIKENEKKEDNKTKALNALYKKNSNINSKIINDQNNLFSKEEKQIKKKYDSILIKEKEFQNKSNNYKELNQKLLILKEKIEQIKEKNEEKKENENIEEKEIIKEEENNQIEEYNEDIIEENKNEEIKENIDNNEKIDNNIENENNINNVLENQINIKENNDNKDLLEQNNINENKNENNKNDIKIENNIINIINNENNNKNNNTNKQNEINKKISSDNPTINNENKEDIKITKKVEIKSFFQNNLNNEQINNINNINTNNLNNEQNNNIMNNIQTNNINNIINTNSNSSININNTINNNPFKAGPNDNILKQAQALDNLQSLAGSRPISKKKINKEITIINRSPNNENLITNAFSGLGLKDQLNNAFNFDDDDDKKKEENKKEKNIIENYDKQNVFDSMLSKSKTFNLNNSNNKLFNGGNISDKSMLNNIFNSNSNNNSSNSIFNLNIESSNNNINSNINPFIQKTNSNNINSNLINNNTNNNPFNNNLLSNNNPFSSSLNSNNSPFNNNNTGFTNLNNNFNSNLNNVNGSNFTFGQHSQSLSNQNSNAFSQLSNNNSNNNNMSSFSFGNFNNINNIQSPFSYLENKNNNIFKRIQGQDSQEKDFSNPLLSKPKDEVYF